MKSLLLVQPSLQPPGGAAGVGAWMLQALSSVHRVSVLSLRPVETDSINNYFGTSLAKDAFETLRPPRAWTLMDRLPMRFALMQSSLLMRYARRIAHRFEVVVGCHNETDYGRPSIQYVHYPAYLRPRPAADLRWYHEPRGVLSAYYALADRVAGMSMDRVRRNLTLANSEWTASLLARSLGVHARTVYPPVADPGPSPPWDQRGRSFVALGRFGREKELERVIRIIAGVRARHPEVTLTLAGSLVETAEGRAYFARLRNLAASAGPWVDIRLDPTRDEIRGLLSGQRYGIHAMREEHFGMAPAEMARAGMLVWVPNAGGQVEIVGDEPQLRYDDEAEAIAKISAVLGGDSEEAPLRGRLTARSERFSAARFVEEMRDIVRDFRS